MLAHELEGVHNIIALCFQGNCTLLLCIWIILSSQLAECSTAAPLRQDLTLFFRNDIVPAISRWQLDPTSVPTSTNVVEDVEDFLRGAVVFLKDMLSKSILTVPQVRKG